MKHKDNISWVDDDTITYTESIDEPYKNKFAMARIISEDLEGEWEPAGSVNVDEVMWTRIYTFVRKKNNLWSDLIKFKN
jgi:hypothetical protein